MIAIIRIKGDVGLKKEIRNTYERLRLKRKYACVVVPENKINLGMIKRLRDFVAFGKINDETFEKLIVARGKALDKTKKIDAKKAVTELSSGKKYEEVNLKSFFRLHPARGGMDTKKHFGVHKGVLGDNKEKINELIRRML